MLHIHCWYALIIRVILQIIDLVFIRLRFNGRTHLFFLLILILLDFDGRMGGYALGLSCACMFNYIVVVEL